MSLKCTKLLPPRWFGRSVIECGRVWAYVVGAGIPRRVYVCSFWMKWNTVSSMKSWGHMAEFQGCKALRIWGYVTHQSWSHRRKWRTCYSLWLCKLDRFRGVPVLGPLSLSLSSSIQISAWLKNWIWVICNWWISRSCLYISKGGNYISICC